jgi:hypothetical protein
MVVLTTCASISKLARVIPSDVLRQIPIGHLLFGVNIGRPVRPARRLQRHGRSELALQPDYRATMAEPAEPQDLDESLK